MIISNIEIEQELERIVSDNSEQLETVDAVIEFVAEGNNLKDLEHRQEEITYVDPEKGYIEKDLVLYLPRINKYAKFEYIEANHSIDTIGFIKEVHPVDVVVTMYN